VSAGPLVMKFGGSSLTDPAAFGVVAAHVAARVLAEDRPAVVVVSAMSGTTGRLQELLDAVHPAAEPGLAATLLTTGETVSAALLAAAVGAAGLPARQLLADEIGLCASGPADRATLEYVDGSCLRAALAEVPVVVVPGGQAVDAAGAPVMLGRNSSDLTAAVLAAILGAPVCELYSDVPGVCTADPHLVPEARVLPRVSYRSMRLLARGGAKVLHEGAIAYAEDAGFELHCCSPAPDGRCRSVIATGPPVAAVALSHRGELVGFGDRFGRARAERDLAARGIEAVPAEVDGIPLLVVSSSGRPPGRLPDGHPLTGTALLTVLHADGRVGRELVPREDAVAELRRRHRELYPDQPGSAVPVKARSPYSGALLGEGS
jgi:aspartate kinase